jgi:UDP-hydrolysing UDP-N-acetyl-D-glucosamine 2-epimerase
MRRICVVLTTRGNFAKAKTVMQAIEAHPELELQLVVGGSLLHRQSAVLDEIATNGFEIAAHLDYMLARETPASIAASAGLCLLKMTGVLEHLDPDVLFLIADRYEVLAIAQAALCCNVRIAHLEGGEVSGSIDERIRHAVTKLAHYHFPANAAAADRIVRMGEDRAAVSVVGSPSLDLLLQSSSADGCRLNARLGATFDPSSPFLLVSLHPVVTEYSQVETQYRVLAETVLELGLPTAWLLPNNDAGAAAAQQALAWIRNCPNCPTLTEIAALPIEEYAAALRHTACLVGNSSSGIREAAFLGTPAVNVGTRQVGRERAANVVDVPCEQLVIADAVRRQMAHGRYAPDRRYGDGKAGEKIAAFLASYWPPLDKSIGF